MSFFRAGIAKGVTRVDREKRTIYGYAVITRGEALGHGLWIDRDMLASVAKAGNAAADGIKCRFTHPGLCADGLGKFLGRARNFTDDGNVVRADLQISDVADSSPDGKLGTYVMDLAEKDPKAFGTSIVFERDTNAEDKFLMEHGATAQDIAYSWGGPIEGFESPDADNVKNYRHARLAALQASDVVDEPAANAGGFFGRGDELAARGDAVLSFVFGLTDQTPDALSMGGMDPARAKTFVQGFLQRRGLSITGGKNMADKPAPKGKLSEDEDKDKKVTAGDPPPPPPENDEDDDEDEDDEKEVAASKKKGKRGSLGRLAELRAAFKGRPDFVLDQYEKGNTVEQARNELNALRVSELEAENAKLKSGGAAPVKFGGENPGSAGADGGDFMQLARDYADEKKVTLTKAMSAITKSHPEAHATFVAAQRAKKTK